MYPETDIPPISITAQRIRKIKKILPELPEVKIDRYVKEYGLNRELATRMAYSENSQLFEALVHKTRADPTLIAITLEETLVSLRREGVKVEQIKSTQLEELFLYVSSRKLAKEAIPEILKGVASGKLMARMKREAIDCPVLGRQRPFLECFACKNFIRRFKGEVHCLGEPL